MKIIHPIQTRRIAKALKPRNPVLAALQANRGPKGAGPHGKTRGALRRAEKMALTKELGE